MLKNQYAYRIEWSPEDDVFIARVDEFPSVTAFGNTEQEAIRELEIALEGVIEWLIEDGEPIPEPLSSNKYQEKISLRIPAGKILH